MARVKVLRMLSSIKLSFRVLLFIGVLLQGIGVKSQNWPSGIHDPSSMIKEGSKYWIFATGDGINSKYSTDMVTWSDGPSPFSKIEFPDWILNYAKTETDSFGGNFWAPDVIYMNNQYYLYYSCSVWGTMNSCIGLVINKTLDPANPDYEWIDQGDIGIYSPDFSPEGTGWNVNAIDPAIMRGHDGKIWMVYGSFNRGGIMITEVDSVTGKPFGTKTSIANSWTGSGYGEGEGGCMFYRNGYYYLVYNKGGCCNGIASSYYMVIGRSLNPRGNFIDKEGKLLRVEGASSGGTILLKHDDNRGLEDRYFGPGHFSIFRENSIDYVSFHYYSPNGYYPSEEANYKGGPTLGLAMLKWGEDGWPVLSFNFIEDGVYSLTNSNSNKVMDIRNHTIDENAYLWQYNSDDTISTQKWLFKSLGTGEYTIQNYADNEMFIEAAGNDNNEILQVTTAFNEAINQKFRIIKDADDRVMVYPSTKDNIFEIPYAYTSDYQIKLWPNTNHACQRWVINSFEVSFSVSAEDVILNYSDTIFNEISISGNGLWSVKFEDDSWLKAFPESGTGEAVLSIHAMANTTDSTRTNKIFINSHAGEVDSVLVTQVKKPKLTGILNHDDIDEIKVYPNPTSGKINVVVTDNTKVSIYNSIGNRILSKDINGSNNVIDIGKFESGLYIFEINTNNIRVQQKVIKE